MTKGLLVLAMTTLVSTGCNRGVCGNDDDTIQPDDDDAGDDDAGDDDAGDDDDDDDTEFAPCDDDTADGTWIASDEGTAELEVEPAVGTPWSLTCDARATMAGTAHAFTGEIDCHDPSFAAAPLLLDGDKSGYGSCIDGEILGELAELGDVAWPWIGEIGTHSLVGAIQIESPDLTVLGQLDLQALDIALAWVNPSTGPLAGGYPVTLYGAGFTAVEDMAVLDGGFTYVGS